MRLIDADALKKKMQGTDRYFQIKYDIDEAPTVVILSENVIGLIRAEIGRCKTQHEMQIAERDTKSKLLISDIFCDVIEIIDKYTGVKNDGDI